MKNRKLSPTILSALVLSFIVSPALADLVAPEVSSTSYAAPAAEPAPVFQSTPVTAAVSPVVTPSVKHTASYTVVKGDSLTSIARKFNTTRKKLRALNNLTASVVKPGQILLVPSSGSAKKSATAKATKPKVHHTYLVAQPVQDFDVPASTFASCPVPLPSPEDDPVPPAPTDDGKPAPVAKLVSPAEMAADSAQENVAPETITPVPRPTEIEPAPSGYSKSLAKATPSKPAPSGLAPYGNLQPAYTPPPVRKQGRSLAEILGFGSPRSTTSDDWGSRFIQQARALGDQGIEYDEDWRPPGESRSWAMDCSNTTRYLYKVTAGIQLPRTASDQYYYLHLQGKAWDVPVNSTGYADGNFLRQNLKPGDLLFWENTYRPERQPPITHVMVYLGTNDQGQWIMAGSQSSRGGEHNRRNGGPDIYIFRPSQPCGGYSTWMGLVHHRGRFCAFGRPLEADPTKLADAEEN
jgi:hypothetical protein